MASLAERVRGAGLGHRFAPAVEGLAHVVEGGRFAEDGTVASGTGRRFLGWAAGRHWYLATAPAG